MSSGGTALTVYQVRTDTFAEACCCNCCFIHDDVAVVTDFQVRCSQAAFAALVLFYSLQGVPGLIKNPKAYLTGMGTGLLIGSGWGAWYGYWMAKSYPKITFVRLINKLFENHAAKRPPCKAIVLAILLAGIIMRSVPPYDRDKIHWVAFLDGYLPGFFIGSMASFYGAFKVVRHLEGQNQQERFHFAQRSGAAYALQRDTET